MTSEVVDRFDRNKWQREHRKKNGNLDTKNYEKTKSGFLMRLYRNMLSRTSGIQKAKYHLYAGCHLLSKDEFKEWSIHSEKFHDMFKVWEDSGYDRKLTPSVDRIDSSKGYELSNMEWVTHSENSRRGSMSRHHRKNL